MKEGHGSGDLSKVIPGHDQQGMLKTMLKRTSLRHWMRSSNIGHASSDGNDQSVCKEHLMDIARFVTDTSFYFILFPVFLMALPFIKRLLPPSQITRFDFSKCIAFNMHLDI
jgi:hypothetical protein